MAETTVQNDGFINQFRYYSTGNNDNKPINDSVWTSNLLTEGPAIKIGIQALPGTKFFIGSTRLDSGIIIDHTGVYELDLSNTTTQIGNLYFDEESLATTSFVDSASIIVDTLQISSSGMVNS